MKINHSLDLTDEQLRAISGRKRNATRKEVRAWLDGLVAKALGSSEPHAVTVGGAEYWRNRNAMKPVTPMGMTCTPMDHVFPTVTLAPPKGTPCYCNTMKWGETNG